MEDNRLTMYVVTHKEIEYLPKDRRVILVGEKNIDGYLKDNTGDNISLKNKYYCELTALYWIWKNDTWSKYVGIEHYRRFFMNKFIVSPISSKKINKYLKKNDIITTKKYKFKQSIKEYYIENHVKDDLKIVEEAIEKMYPQYRESYSYIMNGNYSSMCNMIVLSKTKFNEYCKWLFDILFYVEKNIDFIGRDNYQQRVFGFLSERLQNVWIHHNKLVEKRLPVYYLEKNKILSTLKSLKNRKEEK